MIVGQPLAIIVENDSGKNIAKFIEVSSAEEGRPILFNAEANTQIVTDGRHGLSNGDEVELTKSSAKAHGDKS